MDRSAINSTASGPTGSSPPSLVLVGFMGSGKSSVARALARDLNCEAIDLDRVVEQQAGWSIAGLFGREGEAAFRAHETKALVSVLTGGKVKVIATGGGIVTRQENRILLTSARHKDLAYVVYLKADPETLAQRIRRQPGKRPLIDGDAVLDLARTRARVEELLAERESWYESCADLIVATDNSWPGQVAQRIRMALATAQAQH